MGTWALTFANLALILQATSGVYSSFGDGPQLVRWNEIDDDRPGEVLPKDYAMHEKTLILRGSVPKPRSSNMLDDYYESQLPPPPTREDFNKDPLEEQLIENGIQESSEYSLPNEIQAHSGAGVLETNEILKNYDALQGNMPTKYTNDNNQDEAEDKRPSPEADQSYAEILDDAVKDVIDHLPSSEENQSPLVTVVKLLRKINSQNIDSENGDAVDSEKRETERLVTNHIILKLAKRIQNEIKNAEQHQGESQMKRQTQDDNNLDKRTEDVDQPCDCEDGCQEPTSQETVEPLQSSTSDQDETIQALSNNGASEETSKEEGNPFNMRNPKILAHITISLRKPSPEDDSNSQEQPQLNFIPRGMESNRDFENINTLLGKTRDSGSISPFPIARILFKVSSSKSNRIESGSPTPSFDDDKNDIPKLINARGPFVMKMPAGNCDDNDSNSEDDQTRLPLNVVSIQDSSLSSIRNVQYDQAIPKDFILLRHINDIIRAKAAENTYKRSESNLIPRGFPSTSFEGRARTPSIPAPRFLILRPKKPLRAQLPPLHFPNENSGFEIRNIEESREFPNLGGFLNREILDSDGGNRFSGNILSDIRESIANENAFQEPTKTNPEELKDFIKNLVVNFSGPIGRRSLQDLPGEDFSSPQQTRDEKQPVFLRAFPAPFAFN